MDTLPSIIDIEASGFGIGTYPIEVGYILGSGDTFCSLILPAEGWNQWDASAEKLHGIDQKTLLKIGTPVEQIAQTLNQNLSGATLYSDAWGNDLSWLGLLFDAANSPMHFRIDSIRGLLTEEQLPFGIKQKTKLSKCLH